MSTRTTGDAAEASRYRPLDGGLGRRQVIRRPPAYPFDGDGRGLRSSQAVVTWALEHDRPTGTDQRKSVDDGADLLSRFRIASTPYPAGEQVARQRKQLPS
jgi:hypothetical protein